MESNADRNTGRYLRDASDELQCAPRTSPATRIVDDPATAELSHVQRSFELAGSDPLLPDLTLALDVLEDAVILLHEDGTIIHCNRAATLIALPERPSAIRSLHLLGPGEPWAACRQILREYHEKSGALEWEVRDPGTGKCWSLRLSALAYLGVVPKRLVLVVRDISEAVKTKELLQEREVLAATGALLAGAAHQAKNTIFGLSATLDAFEERIRKEAAIEDDYVNHLRVGIANIQTLLRDLLDYGNPTRCELSRVSMAALVRRSIAGCRSLAAQMGVEFAMDLAEDAEVVANPMRLARALENLLENAVQHSPQAGTVTVRLSRTPAGEGLLRCDVLDQGPGFPPEHIESLFTPFFTRRPGGTGLGLTIAKRIVSDIGGAIRLSNGAAGGAQVAVVLPAPDQGSEHAQLRNRLTGSACVAP